MLWVWRETGDCATNHHLCYARSRDLKTWEAANGASLPLPLRLGQLATYVDPVPERGGIINGCQRLAFDSQQRPVIAYHKRDANGHMQIYVARFEAGQWQTHPVTAWDSPIEFSGGGAMPFIGIALSDFSPASPHRLVIGYRHRDHGSGHIMIDERTLQPVAEPFHADREYPPEIMQPTLDFAGIGVRLRRTRARAASRTCNICCVGKRWMRITTAPAIRRCRRQAA